MKTSEELQNMTAAERVRYEIRRAREEYQTMATDESISWAEVAGRLAGHLDNLDFFARYLTDSK